MSYTEFMLKQKYPEVKLVYSKRFVLQKTNSIKMPLDVRDFCRASETLKTKFLQDNPQIVFSAVMGGEVLQYITDDWSINGALDEWQFPEETQILRKGDCEDMTFYRVAKIISNNPAYRGQLFCALGFVKMNNKWYGHAFPVLIWDDMILHIFEATSNSAREMNAEDYDIYYLISDRFCFEIKKGLFGTAKRKLLKEFGLEVKRCK